jgi:hypothetical protein
MGHEGRTGKLERATTLLNRLERGAVFLPRHNNSWLPDLEAEWLTWTGLADETADQIDAAAYAARHVACQVGQELPMVIPLFPEPGGGLFWGF